MSFKKPNTKDSIFIGKKDAQRLGLKFYVTEYKCSKCGSKPSLRYTVNSNCISCERKRYQKKGDK